MHTLITTKLCEPGIQLRKNFIQILIGCILFPKKFHFIDKHIKMFTDSQTEVMVIDKMGTSKTFQSKSIAAHTVGVKNTNADR